MARQPKSFYEKAKEISYEDLLSSVENAKTRTPELADLLEAEFVEPEKDTNPNA